MAAHLYWRINVTANAGDASLLSIAEMEMRATVNGADQCVGGTASASSSFSADYLPSRIFDNDALTFWFSGSGIKTGWVKYQFPSPVDIVQYTIQAYHSNAARSPSAWTFEYSDDNINWTVVDKQEGQLNWVEQEIRKFHISTGNEIDRWRLNISANAGHPDWLSVANIEMRAAVGGADQCVGGTPFGFTSSQNAALAFDDIASTAWAPTITTRAGQIGYLFMSTVDVVEYTIQANNNAGNTSYSPSAWTLEYSKDGGQSWMVADTRSSINSWSASEVKTFTVTPVASAARPQVFVCT